ncbi:UDP-galactose:MGDG galactosyltransferase family protein [Salix suchowensis]|nr:UDP-galactose:MGDG galactosyltransferase family protein [Salix suchowensis]
MDNKKQHIAIFTTASLPWMTGTAVNPLFRAAFLAKDGSRKVTLVIPWLSLQHQKLVYPNNITFASPSEQQVYVRQWVQERVSFSPGFSIRFYPAKFAVDKRSILAVGDISEVIPDEEADVARWKTKFRLVIGIIHTNYLEYIKREKNGRIKAMGVKFINSWVVEIYCHKWEWNQAFTKGAYYIGKMVWSKGFKELIKLLQDNQKELIGLEVDLYGSGEDSDQVQAAAKKLDLVVRVYLGTLFARRRQKALAMGKIVVCANHPSNDFFKQFPNCRTYDNSNGFVEATRKALTEEPAELTERFLRVADLDQVSARKPAISPLKSFASISLSTRMEDVSAYLHQCGSCLQPDEEQCKELGLAILQLPKDQKILLTNHEIHSNNSHDLLVWT